MAKRKKVPTQQLRILLIKSDCEKDSVILRDKDILSSFPTNKEIPFRGTLYVQQQRQRPPAWLRYIEPYVQGEIDELINASTAAVLILKVRKRKFAITFGYGRNLLSPESFERNFGLKVVLNRVDPESLRSVDCRTFEELTLQTRRQASRGSPLDAFGLNINQDLLRQVAGTPRSDHKHFAKRMAGSDGLMIAVAIRFAQLGDKCKELLAAYESDDYKKRFEFIDYMRNERDPLRVDALNNTLFGKLANKDITGIHFAPPEPIDWHDLDGFTFSGKANANVHSDLDIDEFLATVGKDAVIDLIYLKRRRIGIRYGNSDTSDNRWSVYECITFETDHNGQFYVLTCGEWYEIEKDFVKTVNMRVTALANDNLALPAARDSEYEGDYNARVGKEKGYVVVDKKCQRVGGSPIEPCDLFTREKQFVHVKRKTRSATLSHLFSQGTVAADCFISDSEFRKAFKDIVKNEDPNLAKKLPDARPTPSEFEVVYAIVSRPTTNWPVSLPFFSQLNLMNAADHLERLSYRVSLVRIEQS